MVKEKTNRIHKRKMGWKGERPTEDNFTVFLAGAVSKCKEKKSSHYRRLKDLGSSSEESLPPKMFNSSKAADS